MISDRADRFEALRPELVRHAYRMLGEYGEAEDVAQDAFLRWNAAFDTAHVQDERALARTIVTRLCLDRLRSARAKREVYVGPWLPEPVVSERDDPEAAATLADDISFALLLALERLAPLERAAFLLHDALDVPFAEVAQALGRSEPAVRKLAERAREHVRDDSHRSRTDRNEMLRVRDAFLAAIQGDDPAALERLLTDDVVFTSDGGGKAPAATVPVVGRERVSKLLFGLKQTSGWRDVVRMELVTLNGMPGMATFNKSGVQDVAAFEIVDGRIAAMYVVRNPEKLRRISLPD